MEKMELKKPIALINQARKSIERRDATNDFKRIADALEDIAKETKKTPQQKAVQEMMDA